MPVLHRPRSAVLVAVMMLAGLTAHPRDAVAVAVGAEPVRTAPESVDLAPSAVEAPYLVDHVPRANGCFTLSAKWAGVKVFLVQRKLGLLSHHERYDTATSDAVAGWQADHGLDVTGRVNRATWLAMNMARRFCIDRYTQQPMVGLTASRGKRVAAMITYARDALGVRYVWGGAGPIGYDCSGLDLQAMYAGGLYVPAVTTYLHQQTNFGTAAALYFDAGLRMRRLADRRRGDLVFWGAPGSVTHMAIYLGRGRMLESVRPQVRVASLWTHVNLNLKARVARPF